MRTSPTCNTPTHAAAENHLGLSLEHWPWGSGAVLSIKTEVMRNEINILSPSHLPYYKWDSARFHYPDRPLQQVFRPVVV